MAVTDEASTCMSKYATTMAVAYYERAITQYGHPHAAFNIGVVVVQDEYNYGVMSSTRQTEALWAQADD